MNQFIKVEDTGLANCINFYNYEPKDQIAATPGKGQITVGLDDQTYTLSEN